MSIVMLNDGLERIAWKVLKCRYVVAKALRLGERGELADRRTTTSDIAARESNALFISLKVVK